MLMRGFGGRGSFLDEVLMILVLKKLGFWVVKRLRVFNGKLG